MSKPIIKSLVFCSLVFFAGLANAALSYPGDCKASKIMKVAKSGGCTIEMGSKHHKIKKGGSVVTLLPNSLKSNATCRNIIKAVNLQCK